MVSDERRVCFGGGVVCNIFPAVLIIGEFAREELEPWAEDDDSLRGEPLGRVVN